MEAVAFLGSLEFGREGLPFLLAKAKRGRPQSRLRDWGCFRHSYSMGLRSFFVVGLT